MNLNQLNSIQLEAETALYNAEECQQHLSKICGYCGAKQQVKALIKMLQYIVKETNKLEVDNER